MVRPAAIFRRPRALALWELGRALGGAALLPARVVAFLARRRVLRAELERALAAPAPSPSAPELPALPGRPLRILLSCAESSGELHAARLVEALRALARAAGAPEPQVRALGGARLAALGVPLLADPVARAAMGFEGMGRALPYYLGLVERVARELVEWRPDVFVPVDSPALHVPMGHLARRLGVPVVHFVAPQHWSWAPWRAGGYRRAVDRSLTILPFEPAWFAARGVRAVHVGHPLLDRLAGVPRGRPEERRPRLVLLPGSRRGVIERNLGWMLRRGAELRRAHPGLELAIVQETAEHAGVIEAIRAAEGVPAFVEVGDLHASLRRARAALAVSGTVLIDLLHQRLPAVVVYRVRRRRELWMARHLLATPYFASVNLLAGERALPELCFRGEGPLAEVGAALERCYNDEAWRADCAQLLERAARRLGSAGACERAARHVLAAAARGAALPEPAATLPAAAAQRR